MTQLINELVNYRGDCRTAPATPGLIIRPKIEVVIEHGLRICVPETEVNMTL